MKRLRMVRVWAAAAVLGTLLAVPVGGAPAPAELMGGAPLGVVLGCMACGGAGLAAVFYGGAAALLWRRAAFAAGVACIGVCYMALTT